ncbi:MAG TPA: AAA family ATPase, partial [Mycobacterium sp.]|nr:AAA family ATPase [Mycobacterium sp.]
MVSVLFADLVGYTSRAETLDVEDVEGFLEPYHRLLGGEVERLGGVVAKFTGDGVMALFGVPAAHEDDPERAVRCAVSIRDRLAEHETGSNRLRVRVGVATGEALVILGDDGRVDAIGDVVNTAARLESAAPTDGVLVDEWTYRATDRAIVYQEGDSVQVKGKSAPVHVWRAKDPRSEAPDQVRDDDVLLVGREEELRQLLAVFDRACREGAPQAITVVGPPGIGKSRLLREFAGRVDHVDGRPPRRLHGRSLAYGEGVAFWALSEMVRGEAAISDEDSAETRAAKLEETVERVVDADGNREWVARHLRPLAGLETASELRGQGRMEAFAAWREFLEALAEEQPTILEFEDAHWADDAMLDFVDALAETAAAVPLIVVCTARPELLERRPAWGGGKVNATTLAVAPLTDEETTRLVEALAGEIALPAEASSSLLAHADGNPLYAHEYVRMLRDRGFLRETDGTWHLVEEPTDLPESVYGIIAARLDTLTDAEKQVVQDAAVIGRIGWVGAVAELSGSDRWHVEDVLHALERKQVLRRARHSRIRGDVEFAFGHALIRDVAYRQIRRADRAAKHLRAAEWTQQQARDDLAEILAYHYQAALDLYRGLDGPPAELEERTRHALIAAGRQADAKTSYATAVRHYAAANALMPADDPERPAILQAEALALFRVADPQTASALEAAFDAQMQAGDLWAAAEAAGVLGEWYMEEVHHPEPALRWWSKAEDCAQQSGHKTVLIQVAEGRITWLNDEYRWDEAM